jgi:23S rRNA-/tRNA-specific pseudouridylate synthase
MVWYEDQYFWYVWKPHGIASSWGESFCFLDTLLELKDAEAWNISSEAKKLKVLISVGAELFGKERELWLVNRLDNDTAGLLYFAKSEKVFSDYKVLQKNNQVTKYYVANVLWRVEDVKLLCVPIFHHKHLSDRMVTRRGPQDDGKVRWKKHVVETYLEPLLYDAERNVTTVAIEIAVGVRHQIRVHCASVGLSIIGDSLYGKEKAWDLCLWCVGMSIR